MKPVACIVAVARGNAIGRGNALPWHVPEDLKRFKSLTMGHALVMGRKTHQSIGRALPGRRNIVVSRIAQAFEGCEVVHSIDDALSAVSDDPLPFIIGGAELYRAAFPRVTHLFLTQIDQQVDADVFFPAFDGAEWTEVKREAGVTPGVTFIDLIRKGAA